MFFCLPLCTCVCLALSESLCSFSVRWGLFLLNQFLCALILVYSGSASLLPSLFSSLPPFLQLREFGWCWGALFIWLCSISGFLLFLFKFAFQLIEFSPVPLLFRWGNWLRVKGQECILGFVYISDIWDIGTFEAGVFSRQLRCG